MSQRPRPIPPVGDLSEPQVRGAACVHCAVRLDNGSAVDLGPRTAQQAGVEVRWFPRACRACGA